ncbi:MAG: hypothetical protein Q7S27_01855 [Nanoarchaeota archaeon]|nr:hypothetical protein [Nanoarchaeota archaeon]
MIINKVIYRGHAVGLYNPIVFNAFMNSPSLLEKRLGGPVELNIERLWEGHILYNMPNLGSGIEYCKINSRVVVRLLSTREKESKKIEEMLLAEGKGSS